MSGNRQLSVSVGASMAEISPQAWDALTGDDNPFVEHAFLATLESSGSVGPEAGWAPAHVLVHEGAKLVGACPMYVKSHSYGEYIFDWGWANAAQRMGINYYPKLVSAVPFTPATGPRLLMAGPGLDDAIVDALVGGIFTLADHVEASSVHVLFCTEPEREALEARGLLGRMTFQYHWENDGYTCFDDFLARFRSSERRKVRKERREANGSRLRIRTLTGPQLTEEQWAHLYAFYRDTTARKGAIPYLTQAFFESLKTTLAERVVVGIAESSDRPVAGALAFRRGPQLFGRYWGCLADYDKLHFELCYYRNIELAISEGMRRFEAGAQGQHKIKRGLLPSATWSAHWLRHPALSDAVADYLPREAANHREEMKWLAQRGPFRRG